MIGTPAIFWSWNFKSKSSFIKWILQSKNIMRSPAGLMSLCNKMDEIKFWQAPMIFVHSCKIVLIALFSKSYPVEKMYIGKITLSALQNFKVRECLKSRPILGDCDGDQLLFLFHCRLSQKIILKYEWAYIVWVSHAILQIHSLHHHHHHLHYSQHKVVVHAGWCIPLDATSDALYPDYRI